MGTHCHTLSLQIFVPESSFLAIVYIACMRYYSYLKSAKAIISNYKGAEPFAAFIRKYFATNKKFGSTDRKQISHLCYCYFRMGKMITQGDTESKILQALFLCSTTPNEILAALKPEWNEWTGLEIEKKCSLLSPQYSINQVFPWKDLLSKGIDGGVFSASMLIQPDLFLRMRPRREELVKKKLQAAAIIFKEMSEQCLSLANASKVDTVLELNKEAVVQDYNSQQTGEFLRDAINAFPKNGLRVWDCCAASGGKSIMLYDIGPSLSLTVSDVRESILANLRKRFKEAGITNYKSVIADLANASPFANSKTLFDVILADLPCTGSGTWSRTPEQLYFFDPAFVSKYAALQQNILTNVVPQLAAGGYLLYITCSVFAEENENAVAFLKQNFHLQELKTEVLKGYDKKADSMFACLLQKPL